MSVVFSKSPRKMTPKNKFMVLVTISWLEVIAGASFSNVVVQRNGAVPTGYLNYDPSPLSFGNPQAAALSVTPLKSLVPSVSAIVSPCLTPCILPNTASQELTPIPTASNAKIITYQPAVPNVPVAITSPEASRGYQYAYAVYDDNTGDKKSQSEQSDGSVVKGQYSFIQPDGLLREVVYTADDLKGFNAVVRNISPEPVQPKEDKEEVEKPQPAPCPEPQNAQLTYPRKQKLEEVNSEVDELEEPKGKPKNVEISKESEENDEKVVKEPEEKVEKEKPREQEPRQSEESIENSPPLLKNVISYNDIIKCLQTKLINANSAVSPLTYILIPSLQGPC